MCQISHAATLPSTSNSAWTGSNERHSIFLEPKKYSDLQQSQNKKQRIFLGVVRNICAMQNWVPIEFVRASLSLIKSTEEGV